MKIMGLQVWQTKVEKLAAKVAEEAALKMKADSLELGKARMAFVSKQFSDWTEAIAKSDVLEDVLAFPAKAVELKAQLPEHVTRDQGAKLVREAVRKGASLARTPDEVEKVVALQHSGAGKAFLDSYANLFTSYRGENGIGLQLDKAAPTTEAALALAGKLQSLDTYASEQALSHASKVAKTFDEAFTALKARVPDPGQLRLFGWNDHRGQEARLALHSVVPHSKDPVDLLKALSYLGSGDKVRGQWLDAVLSQHNDYRDSWLLGRTARILGNGEAEAKALGAATAEASTVTQALSVAAVAREGRMPEEVINEAIVKASTLANSGQHEPILELADKIRRGILLEEAMRPKVEVNVHNTVNVQHGDLPEASTLGQAIMDYFGMRRNGGGY